MDSNSDRMTATFNCPIMPVETIRYKYVLTFVGRLYLAKHDVLDAFMEACDGYRELIIRVRLVFTAFFGLAFQCLTV